MTQDALLTAIEEDARELARRIVFEAEEAASGLLSKAEEDAAAAGKVRLDAVRAEVERSKAAAINRARTEARAHVLRTRREVVESVIETALGRLGAMTGPEREGFVKRLFAETMAHWEGLKDSPVPVVSVNPRDAGALNGSGVEITADESIGLGVEFASADGRYRFENTVLSRSRFISEALMRRLNGLLFARG